jgi:integrase
MRTRDVGRRRIVDSTGKKGRIAQTRRTKTAGVYVRHKDGCRAAFGEDRCRCEPSYRGKRRSPTTGKPEWSKTSKDRSEILTWLGAGEKAKPAVAERAQEGRTFASLADEWIDGVSTGRIQRRRRGRPEPYAPTTVPGYRRDLTYLLRPKFGDRPADGIDEREWQAFFDELAREGLSYSRLANVKAVAGSIYAWALHRTRRHVTSNPLTYVDLGPNLGKRRERVALAEEAADLLLALAAEDQVPYGVAFYGGLRRGEIQRLDWVDVEMTEGKPGAWLRVAPAPGKSGEGRRLPIAEPLRAILLRAYQRQGRPSRGRVCEVSVMSGKIAERAMRAWGWDRNSSEDEWRKARADALKPITLHECRHTYASFLMAAGYSLREIMEFMGHADLVTTDRYVKVLPQPAEADRSDRLNAYFRQTDQAT